MSGRYARRLFLEVQRTGSRIKGRSEVTAALMRDPVIVGFDFWQVLSHWPTQMVHLMEVHQKAGDEVHVISAVGSERAGAVADQVRELTAVPTVHEVVYEHTNAAPQLKLDKCRELGVEVFYDDREDICILLARAGILALQVRIPPE